MHRISDANVFLRRMSPAAIDFQIGKSSQLFPNWMPGIVELELTINSVVGGESQGSTRSTIGVAGDWPAFAWLDKRSDIADRTKLRLLLERLTVLCDWIRGFQFQDPIDAWTQLQTKPRSNQLSESTRWGKPHEVVLCETYCLAMFERAILDGCCRASSLSFSSWLQTPLVTNFMRVDSESDNSESHVRFPSPVQQIDVRHTIGLADSLRAESAEDRTSLEWAIDHYGLRFFKIKVCGNSEFDLQRMAAIWEILEPLNPTVTMDGNEAFSNAGALYDFVQRLSSSLPGLWEHLLFLEQPLPRDLTFAETTAPILRQIAKMIPLAIDEADCKIDSFRRAILLGYTGVSHKNCKGIIKSLRNYRLIQSLSAGELFLTGEDLTNVPLIPLHQDLTVASSLGLKHIERNGHHYFPTIDQFNDEFIMQLLEDYPNLYRVRLRQDRKSELTLRIENGKLNVSDLHRYPGLGICRLPMDQNRQTVNDYLGSC